MDDHTDKKGRIRRWPESGDFYRLWFIGALQYSVRWLDTLAISIFAYQQTGSAFTVTMLALLRVLPSALFGMFTGMAADRFQGRTILFATLSISWATSSLMAFLALNNQLAIWHLACAAFVGGTVWSSDIPLRRLLIGRVVGPDRIANAMALDAGTSNASRIAGPVVGGALFAAWGIGGCFAVGAALFFMALIVNIGFTYRHASSGQARGPRLSRIPDSLRAVVREKAMAGFFAITIIYNMFCVPIVSLVPVIAHDHFQLGTGATGLLASMDGVGALLGAVVLFLGAPPQLYARIYVFSVAVYAVAALVFATAQHSLLAGAMLVIAGMGTVGFSIMQSTLIFHGVRPEMRAVMLGLFTVTTGIAPLGLLQIGVLAHAFGAQTAVLISAGEGLLAIVLTHRLWRHIRRDGSQISPTT
ncbi:MFS transporter [Rhizobium ruizarguesonis]|uniref:MFS transporter n=1 Tax=Rhizobium ruizarguesonis TaxID=2081791 RepID=UPI0013EE560B|nr:MFS transporter [Rhizobium ruizarguesonis]